jgi:hypothetical protein
MIYVLKSIEALLFIFLSRMETDRTNQTALIDAEIEKNVRIKKKLDEKDEYMRFLFRYLGLI